MLAVQAREEVKPKLERRAQLLGAYSGGACSGKKHAGSADGKTPRTAAVEPRIGRRPRRLKRSPVTVLRSGMFSDALKRLFLGCTSEPIRILSMQLVLAPAAYLLPRRWALAVANVLSLGLVLLPSPGMVTYCRMRRAYGKGWLRSFQLAWGTVARPYQDFVTLKRILYGREDVLPGGSSRGIQMKWPACERPANRSSWRPHILHDRHCSESLAPASHLAI